MRASFVINKNLFRAAAMAGLPRRVQAELARIYSWDIDFQRDVRPSDHVEILFERYRDDNGAMVHEGRILFATMTLGGKVRPIYYHEDKFGAGGYFKKSGESARKNLLRTPIDGARLTSGFGQRRHPILGFMKQHQGVDFAAPTGTPILAAGDGTIEQSGLNGFYGNYVRIRHTKEFSTAYAHMSRITAQEGSRVRQGQVIGYVGNTGRSTGPHLHYEILKKSQRTNPLKVTMPSGHTLIGTEFERFKKTMSILDYQLAYLAEDARKTKTTIMANINE